MSDFDELLSAVLAADASVTPPNDMERRIKATLHAATQRPGPKRRYPWKAIAAMLLTGFVGMLAIQYRSVVAPKTKPGEERSIAKATAPGAELVPTPVTAVSQKKEHSRHSAPAVRSEQPVRRVVATVASLEVEPLAIEPIEVASLASDQLPKQSPGWEEQQ